MCTHCVNNRDCTNVWFLQKICASTQCALIRNFDISKKKKKLNTLTQPKNFSVSLFRGFYLNFNKGWKKYYKRNMSRCLWFYNILWKKNFFFDGTTRFLMCVLEWGAQFRYITSHLRTQMTIWHASFFYK